MALLLSTLTCCNISSIIAAVTAAVTDTAFLIAGIATAIAGTCRTTAHTRRNV
jgi:hypothetical protein